MKRLFLIRHAKSSWKDTSLQDFDRPLNGRGKQDAPEMGKRLSQKGVAPDAMLSSSAVRAAKTAKAIAEAVGFSHKKISFREDLYHASPRIILEVIRETEDSVDTLFLFGHNPGLTEFANRICEAKVENIVTSGIYAVQLPVNRWANVALDAGGRLLFYDFPKNKKR